MKNNLTLFIPANIKTRTEFFEGFGMAELASALIVMVIATTISVILHFIVGLSLIWSVLLVLFAISADITLVIKDKNNVSVTRHVQFLIRFLKTQKKYPYIYIDYR